MHSTPISDRPEEREGGRPLNLTNYRTSQAEPSKEKYLKGGAVSEAVGEEVNEIPEGWGTFRATCGYWCAAKVLDEGTKVIPLMCGRWTCDMCGRLRRTWFKREARKAVQDHKLQYFWTLTIDHKTCDPVESYELVTAAWNRFRTAWVENHGRLKYLWVVEPTTSGHAHMHVLVDRWMDHEEVSRMWQAATRGSYVVWVEQVEGDRAVHYLAKYLSKFASTDMLLAGYAPLKFRHKYGKSQSIEFVPFRPKVGGWYLVRRPYEFIREVCLKYGHVLKDDRSWLPHMIVETLPPRTAKDDRNPIRILYPYIEEAP